VVVWLFVGGVVQIICRHNVEWSVSVHSCNGSIAASHSQTVLSHEPDTMRAPSGENEIDTTAAVRPLSTVWTAVQFKSRPDVRQRTFENLAANFLDIAELTDENGSAASDNTDAGVLCKMTFPKIWMNFFVCFAIDDISYWRFFELFVLLSYQI